MVLAAPPAVLKVSLFPDLDRLNFGLWNSGHHEETVVCFLAESKDMEGLCCPGPRVPARFQCPARTFSLGLCIHPRCLALEAKTSQSPPLQGCPWLMRKLFTWEDGSVFLLQGSPQAQQLMSVQSPLPCLNGMHS